MAAIGLANPANSGGTAVTPREFDRLMQKFGMEISEGGNHRRARFYYQGEYIFSTLRSRSPRDFSEHKVRAQLGLTPAQLRAAIRCTFNREDYIALLQDKGLI